MCSYDEREESVPKEDYKRVKPGKTIKLLVLWVLVWCLAALQDLQLS